MWFWGIVSYCFIHMMFCSPKFPNLQYHHPTGLFSKDPGDVGVFAAPGAAVRGVLRAPTARWLWDLESEEQSVCRSKEDAWTWLKIGYPLVMSKVCYWKWPLIVDFPLLKMVIFHSYVNLPEGISAKVDWVNQLTLKKMKSYELN